VHFIVTLLSTALPKTSLAIAVDIGGTFTDIALHDANSDRIWRAKTPSVPSDPSQAFLTGIRLALDEAGHTAPSLQRVLHGTTVATNMILEGKGARTALVTPRAAMCHIGRQDIPATPTIPVIKPARPVPASRARSQSGRPRGRGAAPRRGEREGRGGCPRIGVERSRLPAFLRQPRARAGSRNLRDAPPALPSLSTDALAVREYERSLATVLNAVDAGRLDRLAFEDRPVEEKWPPRC
jgi:N-methylhydantoinase A